MGQTTRWRSITVGASAVIPADRLAVFTATTDHHNAAEVLGPVGPMPGVARATIAGSGTVESGAHRKVWTTGGARLDETIVVHRIGRRHVSRWRRGLHTPWSRLVRGGVGTLAYTDEPGGTRIDWTYRFELTSPLVCAIVAPVVAGPFRWWMRAGLRRAADLFPVERAALAAPLG